VQIPELPESKLDYYLTQDCPIFPRLPFPGSELDSSYCTPFISDIRVDDGPHQVSGTSFEPKILCKIDFKVERELEEQINSGCWHRLFRNPVIAKGFPIPSRTENNTGLEMPLNMMADLIEASRATTFDGQLVIKGFCTMLVPTRYVDNMLF
jgi:hypothetical protein